MKFNNCHGKAGVQPARPRIEAKPAQKPAVESPTKAWGVPGEEHKLVVAPVSKDRPIDDVYQDLAGKPGFYKVQVLLSRPGYPMTGEREHKFIDGLVGTSHLTIAKPKRERTDEDVDHLLLEASGDGKNSVIHGFDE